MSPIDLHKHGGSLNLQLTVPVRLANQLAPGIQLLALGYRDTRPWLVFFMEVWGIQSQLLTPQRQALCPVSHLLSSQQLYLSTSSLF